MAIEDGSGDQDVERFLGLDLFHYVGHVAAGYHLVTSTEG
jgi:hypothetical protein